MVEVKQIEQQYLFRVHCCSSTLKMVHFNTLSLKSRNYNWMNWDEPIMYIT